MNRKMTLLALAAKCGFFGASGLTNFVAPSAAIALRTKKPSPEEARLRATPAKPAAGFPEELAARAAAEVGDGQSRLIQIHKLIQVQGQEAELPEGLFG